MLPAQHDDGVTGLQPQNNRRREVPAEVRFARGERTLDTLSPLYRKVLDIAEALGAQQFFGDPLRAAARAGKLRDSEPLRFGW